MPTCLPYVPLRQGCATKKNNNSDTFHGSSWLVISGILMAYCSPNIYIYVTQKYNPSSTAKITRVLVTLFEFPNLWIWGVFTCILYPPKKSYPVLLVNRPAPLRSSGWLCFRGVNTKGGRGCRYLPIEIEMNWGCIKFVHMCLNNSSAKKKYIYIKINIYIYRHIWI